MKFLFNQCLKMLIFQVLHSVMIQTPASPYRVINWSMGSDTSSVTGGKQGRNLAASSLWMLVRTPKIKQVIQLIEELLDFFDGQAIDL